MKGASLYANQHAAPSMHLVASAPHTATRSSRHGCGRECGEAKRLMQHARSTLGRTFYLDEHEQAFDNDGTP